MQPEATFTASVKVGHQNIEATVVCIEQDNEPVVLWVEVDGGPVPTWLWDLVEADIRANGPCAYAYRQAASFATDKPLQTYVARTAAQDERDMAAVRDARLWNGEAAQ